MTEVNRRTAIKGFIARWQDKENEDKYKQPFWLALLRDVFEVEYPEQIINFEKRVKIEKSTKRIDGYIESTKVLIEHKSVGISFSKAFEQAVRYKNYLPHSEHPRWIVLCNFQKFLIYDMEYPNNDPEEVWLKDLEKDFSRLLFLIDDANDNVKRQKEVSEDAGKIVGILYNALLKQYDDQTNHNSLKSLNILCVRIVFCLYAEDAGIFEKNQFHDYLNDFKAEHLRSALLNLFKVLNTPLDERNPYLEPKLKEFQYVNGGLFSGEEIEIPNFTEEIKEILLTNASQDFDWSEISPTIFGALFESTMNPETRRKGGQHFTSIENIHKVIDPLFMDELNAEFRGIKQLPKGGSRNKKLLKFQEKISQIKFLDPACGSGNFLTETYLSLRRLENEILKELYTQRFLGDIVDPVKVSINQFFGIEINDFAVSVARTALWISESQMLQETEDIVHKELEFLPLKTYENIVEANALRIDWETVIPKSDLNYIMGNPPFGGYKYQTRDQKLDISAVYVNEKGKPYKNSKKNDYVSCWYFKAAQLMRETNIKTAFVSTNSITQGEQVASVWKPLYNKFGIHIDFAYKTFKWKSESTDPAQVFCVIIGFSCGKNKNRKKLFSEKGTLLVGNINFYLNDAPNVFISSSNVLTENRKEMIAPNKPCDYNCLKIENSEYEEFISKDPKSKRWIKLMVGAQEFIHNKTRYCLWLVDCPPGELRSMPLVMDRVRKCKEARIKANTSESLKLAQTPTLFREQINPESCLLIPCVSSEKREYIPMGFINKDIIPVMGTLIIPNADLFDFGILTSSVHMSWMRTVCGRLEMRYRYSKDIVYNNFPWCNPTKEQKAKIEKTAQEILDARALFPGSSLADLYDEMLMPIELRNAHQHNDQAVMEVYGFPKDFSESEIVAELMKMYQKLTTKTNN